jgi:hypothetical protein
MFVMTFSCLRLSPVANLGANSNDRYGATDVFAMSCRPLARMAVAGSEWEEGGGIGANSFSVFRPLADKAG